MRNSRLSNLLGSSSARNSPEAGFKVATFVALPAVLQILALLVTAAYAAGPQATYTEPVNWGPILTSLLHGQWKFELIPEDYWIFGASMTGLLLTIASRANPGSLLRLFYFTSQLFLFGSA